MICASRVYKFKLGRLFNGKKIAKLENDDSEDYEYSFESALSVDDNKAVSVSFAGYMVATGLLTWSSFSNLNAFDGWLNVLIVIVWQILGVIFLEVARICNDKIALREVKIRKRLLRTET